MGNTHTKYQELHHSHKIKFSYNNILMVSIEKMYLYLYNILSIVAPTFYMMFLILLLINIVYIFYCLMFVLYMQMMVYLCSDGIFFKGFLRDFDENVIAPFIIYLFYFDQFRHLKIIYLHLWQSEFKNYIKILFVEVYFYLYFLYY